MDVLLKDMNPVLQLLLTMAMFTLLPFVFMCMTSFLRFVIVFSMLKTAIQMKHHKIYDILYNEPRFSKNV